MEINNCSGTKIIISVSNNVPSTDNASIDKIQFHLGTICIKKSKRVPNKANNFESIRYNMRHGNGFKSW